jgi:NAD(P)-dependent dehydrogenase (short-subunit alcohol dehydrogenase family)
MRDAVVTTFFSVNHAVYEDKPSHIRDMSLSQWETTFTSNLTSSFLVIRAFLRQLDQLSDAEKEKVAIVLIGSTAGKYGEAGAYDAARRSNTG